VFISSPNDLVEDRRQVSVAIRSLSGQEVGGFQIELVPLLWEDTVPAVIGQPAQAAVDYYLGRATEMHIYIGMFWTRLGSPVVINDRRYPSGTMYELQDAYASLKRTGRPKMLLYRCVRGAPSPVDENQTQAVAELFRQFGADYPQFEGLPRVFHDTDELVRYVQRDLMQVLERDIAERAPSGAASTRGLEATGARGSRARRDRVLLSNVQSFLSNYEDLFGQGREKEHHFPTSFRVHATAADLAVSPVDDTRASSNELLNMFEKWGRRILFIGPGGSGKTFAMLQLMQDMVDRARREPRQPIPIYFNLSTWALTWSVAKARQGPKRKAWLPWSRTSAAASETLDSWLVDELVRWYSVPRSAAKSLVSDRKAIFCLDGLDELVSDNDGTDDDQPDLEARDECVATINRTLKDQSVQMVLCCREDTFRRLKQLPAVGCTLQTLPLALSDAVTYLHQWASLDGLCDAVEKSHVLQSQVQLPLFLRLMATAYQGMNVNAIVMAAERSQQAWQNHLMDNYVHQCLSLAIAQAHEYTSTDVATYLSWFSKNMPPAFLVEDLQPNVLEGTGVDAFRQYQIVSVFSLACLLAFTSCFSSGAAIGVEWSAFHDAGTAVYQGFKVFAVTAAITVAFSIPAFACSRAALFAVAIGTAFGLVRGAVITLSPAEGLGGTLQAGVSASLVSIPCGIGVFGLFGYQTFGKIEQYKRRYRRRPGIDQFEIMPVEAYDWHWVDPDTWWRGGWTGVLVGPLTGLVFWAVFGEARGLGFGLFVTLFVTAFSGLSGTGIRVSLNPNQGIRRSLQHAAIMSTLFTTAAVSIFALSYSLAFGTLEAVVNGLLGIGASCTFLAFGGIPFVRHVCLGHVLHLHGALPSWFGWPPWGRTVAFLDDMVRYKLLRRTAGGYSFRHDFIRQHYRKGTAE